MIMEACAEVFAEVNIDARCQSGHVFLPHPAQEYSFWTRGTSQLMSVPEVHWILVVLYYIMSVERRSLCLTTFKNMSYSTCSACKSSLSCMC